MRFQPRYRARAEHEHAVRALAASAFCQEKVATSSFGQSMSIANAADVASQMVRPCRSFLIQSPLGTRTPEVVPFHRKTTS